MQRNVVTTELVADEPVVVVIHHEQPLVQSFQRCLSQEKLRIEYYSVTELIQSPAIQQRLSEAYKIAWITGTQEYIQDAATVERVDQLLIEYQYKTTLFFPIVTSFIEQVPGELPYAQQLFKSQEEIILFHNSYLPSATFLFGQDIILGNSSPSFMALLVQDLGHGKLYGPTINFHPQSLESYIYRALRYFLQPQRSSVLIRGNSIAGSTIAYHVKQLYQSYHFTMVDVQEIVAQPQSAVPFSIKENFVTDDAEGLISKFVQTLPTPGGLPKESLWHQLFGSLQPALPDYGTEVDESSVVIDMQPEYDEIVSSPPIVEKENSVEESTSSSTLPQSEKLEKELQSEKTESAKKKEEFDLNQEIQHIFSTTHIAEKKQQTKKVQEKKKIITKKSKKRTAVFYGGLAFTGMGLGIVCLGIIFLLSVTMLRQSLNTYLIAQATATEETKDVPSLGTVKRMTSIVDLQTSTYSLLLSLPALEDAKNLVVMGGSLKTAADNSAEANKLAETLYLQVIGKDSGDAIATAANLGNKTLAAYESLASFYEKLEPFVETTDDANIKTAADEYKSEVSAQRISSQSLQQLGPLLPDLLGKNHKRTYAVIFQNNQELRPTGGFIEDVALMTFENGSLISTTVLSSKEVNDKLAGSVVPPQQIKQYLGESSWNFWDGNWNPHFPDTATQLTWFLEKTEGVTVDGVMTIDLDGMAKVLEVTGPLDLPQYNEVLTHKNLQDRFEFHSEISLVDTKQDYRKEVFQAFLNKVTSLPAEKISPFLAALQENLTTQHSLLAFSDADELNATKALSWSGSLLQPNCPSQLASEHCVVDSVAQVEANVGINKANYYLKRSVEEAVAVGATQSAHTRTITYENTAQTDSWPKGPYKVFVRLYLPSSAVPGSVSVDGVPLSAAQVSTGVEVNRKVIGFYTEVPVKQTQTVTVSYSIPYSQPSKSFAYTFFEQQQPGSGVTPFTLKVTPVTGLHPSVIAPQASVDNNTIVFTKSDSGHGFFGVTFN